MKKVWQQDVGDNVIGDVLNPVRKIA